MEKTKEELNKHWWHRLYKIILITGSIIAGFTASFAEYDFIEILTVFIFFSFLTFLGIFLTYRLILYIIFSNGLFFSKKERKRFLIYLLIFIIYIAGMVYYYNKPTINKSLSNEEYPIILSSTPIEAFNLIWTIKEIYDLGDELKEFSGFHEAYKTEGKFIEVVVEVNNNKDHSIWLPYKPKFKVKNNKGEIYNEKEVGIGRHRAYSKNTTGWDDRELSPDEYARDEIKPSIPYTFSAFFEVSKNSGDYIFIIDK